VTFECGTCACDWEGLVSNVERLARLQMPHLSLCVDARLYVSQSRALTLEVLTLVRTRNAAFVVCVEGEHSSLAGGWNTCGAPGWSLSGLKTLVLSVFTQAKHCVDA